MLWQALLVSALVVLASSSALGADPIPAKRGVPSDKILAPRKRPAPLQAPPLTEINGVVSDPPATPPEDMGFNMAELTFSPAQKSNGTYGALLGASITSGELNKPKLNADVIFGATNDGAILSALMVGGRYDFEITHGVRAFAGGGVGVIGTYAPTTYSAAPGYELKGGLAFDDNPWMPHVQVTILSGFPGSTQPTVVGLGASFGRTF